MKKLGVIIGSLIVILTSISVFAAGWVATLIVSNNSSTAYTMLASNISSNVTYLVDQHFINSTGNDTQMQSAGANMPYMLATDRITFAHSIGANTNNSYQLLTGQTERQYPYSIVTGYGGYITTADNTSLEPSSNFSHRMSVYLNTSANFTTKGNDLIYYYDSITGNLTATLQAGSATTTPRVNAGNDDVTIRHSDDSIYAGGLYLRVGSTGVVDNKWGSAMRFNSIPIYQGSTITNAFLTFTADANLATNDTNSRISAEKKDNPGDFNGLTGAQLYTRYTNHTTAQVNYDTIPAWTTDTTYNTGNISSVITEIINRYGWAYNNSMVLFWEDFEGRSFANAYRSAYSFDGSAAKAPLLTIVYQNRQQVTIVSVPSGSLADIRVQEDSTNFWATADTATTHYGSSNKTAIAVNDNTSPYVLLQNIPYADNVTFYKGGNQNLLYKPNTLILGTTMPDIATDGVNNDGVITWGSNPAGISVTMSSFEPSTVSVTVPSIPDGIQDIAPLTTSNGTKVNPQTAVAPVTPISPLMQFLAGTYAYNLPEFVLWVLMGWLASIIAFAFTLSIFKHIGAAGIIGSAIWGLFVVLLHLPAIWISLSVLGMAVTLVQENR